MPLKEKEAPKYSAKRIVPLGCKVQILPEEPPEKSKGGILFTDNAKEQERPFVGLVVAVGPGEYQHGQWVTCTVSPGQRVAYERYSGMTIEVDGVCYCIVKESQILAVIPG